MQQLTAEDALLLIIDYAQKCRESGDCDMRDIIGACSHILSAVKQGKSREEIIADFSTDEDEDE